jgi:hypothetical protein
VSGTRKSLEALYATPSDGFLDLVQAAKLDPGNDFIGADLTQMNFRGLDLSGFNFYGADSRGSNLEGAWLRADRCIGALFGESLPHIVEPEGTTLGGQAWLPLVDGPEDRFVFMSVRQYTANRLAFDRMGFILRLVQDAPSHVEIRRFALIALERERSSWCRRLLAFLADDLTGVPRGLLVGQALDAAVRTVHSLRRHELLHAIKDHMARTTQLLAFLTALRQRTRSPKNIDAIDKILASASPLE